MAQGEVARLSVGFTADTSQLDRAVSQGERKIRDVSQKLEKGLQVGKFIAAMAVIAKAGPAAFQALNLGVSLFQGNMIRAAEAVDALGEALKGLPLAGPLVGLGEDIGQGLFTKANQKKLQGMGPLGRAIAGIRDFEGDSIFGKTEDAAAANEETKRKEREQALRTKQLQQFQKTEQQLNDEIELLRASEKDRDRIKLDQQRRAALRSLGELTPGQRDQLTPLIQERFDLQLRELKTPTALGAQITSRQVFNGERGLTPASKPVTKEQGDKQIKTLEQIAQYLARNPGLVFQ